MREYLNADLKSLYPDTDETVWKPLVDQLVNDFNEQPLPLDASAFPESAQDLVKAWNEYCGVVYYKSSPALEKWYSTKKGALFLKMRFATLRYVSPNADAGPEVNARNKTLLDLAKAYKDDPVVSRIIYLFANETNESTFPFLEKHAENLDPWLKEMILGRNFLAAAWDERGGGYAGSVTEEGWIGFKENLIQAKKHFEAAHQIQSSFSEAASQMVELSVICSEVPDNEYWLKTALEREIDSNTAIYNYAWYHLPRWCGSTNGLLNFAEALIRNHKPGTKMALRGLRVIDVALAYGCGGYQNAMTILKDRPEMYDSLKKAFEQMRKDKITDSSFSDLYMLEA